MLARPRSAQADLHSDPALQGAGRGRAVASGERRNPGTYAKAPSGDTLGSCAMSDRDALLREITSKAVVHGKVTLSSGREADYYVDLRRITLDATAAPLVGAVMLDLTETPDFDAAG